MIIISKQFKLKIELKVSIAFHFNALFKMLQQIVMFMFVVYGQIRFEKNTFLFSGFRPFFPPSL